jgi:hypothetical protein
MNEWFDNQKKLTSSISKLLQERIEKANPRRKLTAEEIKRYNKLEAITGKLKRGENVQNPQLYLTKIFLNQLLLITYCKMAIKHSNLNLLMTKY